MTTFGLRARLRERAHQLGRRSLLFDVAMAAVITAVGLFGCWLLTGPLADIHVKLGVPPPGSAAVALAGTAGMTAPLALRRLFPVGALAVITAAYVVVALAKVPEYVSSSIALLVAVYTVGAYAPRLARGSRALHLAVVAAVSVYQLATADYGRVPGLDPAELAIVALYDRITTVVVTVIAFTFAWILGDTVRRTRQRQAELADRTAELAAANQTIARQAVADERLRIARELHDVVAHHVSVMGLQAGAARRVLDRDRESAVRALHVVEDTGRRAVDELQRLLGMLRRSDGTEPAGPGHNGSGHNSSGSDPQPAMSNLVDLVERMRDTGLDVRVRTTGAQPELPAGVELSVYRVVQEALTNALKHAGSSARVDVDLQYSAEQLRLAVRSRAAPGARRPSRDLPTAGRGLIGMRERVGLHGGELRTGALGDDGFEVLATIPV